VYQTLYSETTAAVKIVLLQECTDIFSKGGGEALAQHFSVPFLGVLCCEPYVILNTFVH